MPTSQRRGCWGRCRALGHGSAPEQRVHAATLTARRQVGWSFFTAGFHRPLARRYEAPARLRGAAALGLAGLSAVWTLAAQGAEQRLSHDGRKLAECSSFVRRWRCSARKRPAATACRRGSPGRRSGAGRVLVPPPRRLGARRTGPASSIRRRARRFPARGRRSIRIRRDTPWSPAFRSQSVASCRLRLRSLLREFDSVAMPSNSGGADPESCGVSRRRSRRFAPGRARRRSSRSPRLRTTRRFRGSWVRAGGDEECRA